MSDFSQKRIIGKSLQIEQRPLMVNDKLCKDRAFFFVAHKRGQKKYYSFFSVTTVGHLSFVLYFFCFERKC